MIHKKILQDIRHTYKWAFNNIILGKPHSVTFLSTLNRFIKQG